MSMRNMAGALLRWTWIGLVAALCVLLWPFARASGNHVLPVALIAIAALTLFCFTRARRPWPWLYPLLLAVLLGIVLPIANTFMLAQTATSAIPAQSLEQAWQALLTEEEPEWYVYSVGFALDAQQRLIIQLAPKPASDPPLPWEEAQPSVKGIYHSPPLLLVTDAEHVWRQGPRMANSTVLIPMQAGPAEAALLQQARTPSLEFMQARQKQLGQLQLQLPAGVRIRLLSTRAGQQLLTEVPDAAYEYRPRYAPAAHAGYGPYALRDRSSGELIIPDRQQGLFFVTDAAGQQKPLRHTAFYGANGWANYQSLLSRAGPLVRQLLWCLLLSTGILALALPATLLNAWCLQHVRGARVWLGVIVLPAAVPVSVALLLFKAQFFRPWLIGDLWESHANLVWRAMIIAPQLWLTLALLTLFMHRISRAPAASLKQFVWTRSRAAAPGVLMTGGMLFFSSAAALMVTEGHPYPEDAPGLTSTLTSLPLQGLGPGAGAALLTLLFLPALLMGLWRLRLLHKTPIECAADWPGIQVSTCRAKVWHYAYLALTGTLSLLPLLFGLALASGIITLRAPPCPEAAPGLSWFSCRLQEPTLHYWRLAAGARGNDEFGGLASPVPWLQWMVNSWKSALVGTLFSLTVALSAAWGLHRHAFRSRQWLENAGCMLQFIPLPLLVLGAGSLVLQAGTPFAHAKLMPLLSRVVLFSGSALLALYPLLGALRRQPAASPRSLLTTLWRPMLAVWLLLMTLHLGDYLLEAVALLSTSDYARELWTFSGGGMMAFNQNIGLYHEFAAASVLFSLLPGLLFLLLVALTDRDLVNHWRPSL